jgi:predicted small integral membrane protein
MAGTMERLPALQAGLATRLAKSMLSLVLATFALLVAVDNIIDYGTNYAFVQHVLSMDTVFPGSRLTWRAIRDPMWWQAGYLLIIAGEMVTGLLFLAGGVQLLRRARAPAACFAAAKVWCIAGACAGLAVWLLGFLVVGGEWFQMWQSSQWNGQEAAFRFAMIILAILIFINQPDEGPQDASDAR